MKHKRFPWAWAEICIRHVKYEYMYCHLYLSWFLQYLSSDRRCPTSLSCLVIVLLIFLRNTSRCWYVLSFGYLRLWQFFDFSLTTQLFFSWYMIFNTSFHLCLCCSTLVFCLVGDCLDHVSMLEVRMSCRLVSSITFHSHPWRCWGAWQMLAMVLLWISVSWILSLVQCLCTMLT